MSGYAFALVGAVVTLGFMVELLRRRRLREKYAALWIAVAAMWLSSPNSAFSAALKTRAHRVSATLSTPSTSLPAMSGASRQAV